MSDVPALDLKTQAEYFSDRQPQSEAAMQYMSAQLNFLRELIYPVGTVLESMLDETTFQAETSNPTPERWILADGRDVSGSVYQLLTGLSVVPDLRGQFARAKNNGRSDGQQNPDGEIALASQTADKLFLHAHGNTDPGHIHGLATNNHAHTVRDLGHHHALEQVTNPGIARQIGQTANVYDSGNNGPVVSAFPPFQFTFEIASSFTGIGLNSAISNLVTQGNGTGISVQNSGSNESVPKNVTVNYFIRIN